MKPPNVGANMMFKATIPAENHRAFDPEPDKTGSTPLDRLERHPNSRKAAIDAFCWQCMGGANHGTRRMIRECTAPRCALFRFRPFQHVKTTITAHSQSDLAVDAATDDSYMRD